MFFRERIGRQDSQRCLALDLFCEAIKNVEASFFGERLNVIWLVAVLGLGFVCLLRLGFVALLWETCLT